MSETTEFKDVYEAIASVSPNRQNILYTVLEEDAFGEKAFFSDDKLVWESTKGGFFSQNQEEVGKLHDSGQATAAGKKLFCDCLGGEKRLVIWRALRSFISVWPVRIPLKSSLARFCIPWILCGRFRIPAHCTRIWCWQNGSSERSFAVTMYASTRSLTAKRRSIFTAS